MTNTKHFTKDYIETHLAECSLYTPKIKHFASGMIHNHNIKVPLPIRHIKDVKRNQEDSFNDKHISRTGKYVDIFIIATSCRRCDF